MILTFFFLAGCGDSGSYELRWTIGCEDATDPSCRLESARECSRRGLDSVEVLARQNGDVVRSVFRCFSPNDGPVGRGPDLEAKPTLLSVYGLSPSGLRLTEKVDQTATIPESGLVPVKVNLPEPPECGDGVDNDDDGMVDLLDPGCVDGEDTDERE